MEKVKRGDIIGCRGHPGENWKLTNLFVTIWITAWKDKLICWCFEWQEYLIGLFKSLWPSGSFGHGSLSAMVADLSKKFLFKEIHFVTQWLLWQHAMGLYKSTMVVDLSQEIFIQGNTFGNDSKMEAVLFRPQYTKKKIYCLISFTYVSVGLIQSGTQDYHSVNIIGSSTP